MRKLASLLAVLTTLAIGAPDAAAAFHLMKVVEVYGGSPADPNAQFVVLQMYSGGQNIVGGHNVIVFDASGTEIMSFAFAGNVASGVSQDKILIATTEAEALFNVTADLTMTAVIPAAGGKVCFDAIDCVSWGNYSGGDVGTPVSGVVGLFPARSIVRRLDIDSNGATLSSADDTGDSANDFAILTPNPVNNAGDVGTPPANTCPNNTVEGLEQCDDGNATDGDGCSSTCEDETLVLPPDAGPGDTPDAGDPNAPDAANNPNNPDSGAGGGDDGGGCGCRTTGANASWALALLALVSLRRRRRR